MTFSSDTAMPAAFAASGAALRLNVSDLDESVDLEPDLWSRLDLQVENPSPVTLVRDGDHLQLDLGFAGIVTLSGYFREGRSGPTVGGRHAFPDAWIRQTLDSPFADATGALTEDGLIHSIDDWFAGAEARRTRHLRPNWRATDVAWQCGQRLSNRPRPSLPRRSRSTAPTDDSATSNDAGAWTCVSGPRSAR